MKVLIINDIGFRYAGAESMVDTLKRGLVSQGHQVRILSSNVVRPGELMADATYSTYNDKHLLRILLNLLNISAYTALRSEIHTFQPDIVHFHNAGLASPIIYWATGKAKIVLTIHDHTVFDPTKLRNLTSLLAYEDTLKPYFTTTVNMRWFWEKFRFMLLRRAYRKINVVVSPSSCYLAAAEESNLFQNIVLIPNGVALPKSISPITGTNNLLYVGRLAIEKGLQIILSAIVELPSVKISIVGDGPYLAELKLLSKKNHLTHRALFLGRRDEQQVRTLIRECSAVVIPSIYPDNLPTLCLEAMSEGRPVIGSAVGGIPDMIRHEKTGILYEARSSADASLAISALFNSNTKALDMGKEARKLAIKEFGSDLYTMRHIRLYQSILARQ